MSIVDELEARGLYANCTDRAGLSELLTKEAPVSAYAGYDPTAPSLHVGNLVPTILLKRLQLAGHRPIIVVGGATSNNTRELVKTCAQHCARVHHVQTDADVRSEWLIGAEVVGLTAGTSTPDEVIDRVEARIRQIDDDRVGTAGAAAAGSIR